MEYLHYILFISVILPETIWAGTTNRYVESMCGNLHYVTYRVGAKTGRGSVLLRTRSYSDYFNCTLKITAQPSYARLKVLIRKTDFRNGGGCMNYVEIKITVGSNYTKKLCTDSGKANLLIPDGVIGARQITIHYVRTTAKGSGTEVLVTAYKPGQCKDYFNFDCLESCISDDLICDGYNNCGRNEDESYERPAQCMDPTELRNTLIYGSILLFIMISGTAWFIWKGKVESPAMPPYCCSACPFCKQIKDEVVTKIIETNVPANEGQTNVSEDTTHV